MTNIYTRIKEISDIKQMPISELERKADIGSGTIRRWNESMPTADKLQRVAKVLRVDMEYLLTGDTSENEITVLAREIGQLTDKQKEAILSIIEQFNV